MRTRICRFIDRIAWNWLKRRHQTIAPKGWTFYPDIDGPTPDSLGPQGAVGHFFALHGVQSNGQGECVSTCYRGKTAEECWQRAREANTFRPMP